MTLAALDSPASTAVDLSTGAERKQPREYLTLPHSALISNDSFHAWNDRI
jgi:hypothetical protein